MQQQHPAGNFGQAAGAAAQQQNVAQVPPEKLQHIMHSLSNWYQTCQDPEKKGIPLYDFYGNANGQFSMEEINAANDQLLAERKVYKTTSDPQNRQLFAYCLN